MKKNRSILSDLAHIIGTYWQVFFSCKQTKLCVLFSLFAACIFVPQKTYSQSLDDKITFELHNQPLHKGLKQLGEISGFKLAYTIQQVEKYKSVSVEKGTRSVEATLKLLLAKTDLNYTLKSNTILLTAPVSSNRKRKVTGVITDKNDIPVLGVTIRDSGTNTAVVSNMNGYYSIEVPEATTLIYSFVGMHPIIEEIGNRNSINVRMSEEINELKGVEIVSTGYQSLPKERVTGSFVQISSKDLKMTPTINIMERIEGMVPGVNVDVRNNKITIRGKNTYYTPTKSYPLIVIDGFPFIEDELTKPANGNLNGSAVGVTGNSVLSRINPEDIESITILKDAAAASIWGARAANGVIVIETKKGKQGTPNVTFTTNISVSAPADLKKLDRMNSAQYIALERELKENGFLSDPIANYYPSWMPFNYNAPLSDAAEWMFKVDRGTATAEEAETALAAMSKINNYDQIKKYLLQKAISQQYNLSLSGGGPTNTYYISSNYSKDIPVFRSNNAESYFVTANQGNSFLDNRINLKTGISYNYTNSKNNQAAINALGSTTMGLRPYDLLVDENGKTIQHSILFTQGVADDFLSKGYLPWTYSPLDELNYSNTITKTNRIQLNASLEAKLTYWLSVSVSGSYQKKSGTSNILDELNSYVGRSMINTATTIDETSGKLVYNIPYGGKLITTNNDGEDYSYRGQFNINKIWKNKMSLTMLGGAEARQSKTTAYQQTRYGFVEDTYTSQAYSPSASYNTVYGWTSTLAYSDSQISKATTRFLSYYTNGAVGLV
jgi:TonB-dependent SusC/RagA subfamily outer membrane receptor